jgi:hypothetical protein
MNKYESGLRVFLVNDPAAVMFMKHSGTKLGVVAEKRQVVTVYNNGSTSSHSQREQRDLFLTVTSADGGSASSNTTSESGYCVKCGGGMPANAGFCPKCGTPSAV